jgi:cyclohexa-1,5-dienecarbonyl-CoA hydratase
VSFVTVRVDAAEGIGHLVLTNPPLNILTRAALAELRAGLARLEGESMVRVLLLSANGKHFSAGADVGEHLPPLFKDLIPEFLDTVRAIHGFPLPVVVAVHGRCLGAGFELAVAGDIIIAGEGASLGQPEIMLGVLPPAACAFLPLVCPPGVAAELVFTGDAIDAREAKDAGIVRRVVSDELVEETALDVAKRIARHSAAALRLTKQALRGRDSERQGEALAHAGAVYVDDLMKSQDALEGLEAFMAKRRPTWSHR